MLVLYQIKLKIFMNNQVYISVIVPVYNSSNSLKKIAALLVDELNMINSSYEIIFINDASTDNSYEVLKLLAFNNKDIKVINLTKNFGQDNAIMSGLNNCCGELIVIMDDDLQHDPKDISSLIKGLSPSFDVSYGMYEQRKDGFFKSLMSKFNNMTATIILGKPYKLYLSPFKAFKADIKDEIIKYINPYPYIDGLILRVTNNINQVKISHFSRDIGGSGYNFIKSLSVWLNLFTSFSIIPLRVSSIIGFLTSLGSFILSIYFYISYLQGMDPPEGWQSTVLIILFLGGIQLMTLGIIGEYLGRLYLSQSNLPQYSIKEILNDK